MCDPCHDDLPWIEPRSELAPFTVAIAPLEYRFPIDAAIKAMKFRRKMHYAAGFAYLLERSLDLLPGDVDGLMPVPLHWRRQMFRGFNQAAEVSRPLSRLTGLELLDAAVRNRATPYQSGLAAAHRRRNLKSAFTLRRTPAANHVVIVDDVITTGATCRELGRLLLESGVGRVSVLAIARASPG